MIIPSVKLFNFKNNNSILNSSAVNNFACTYNTSPINDKFEISFNGLFETSTEPARLEQARNITGIHCPACGVKMLSPDEYEKIIKEAGNIKKPEEFVILLKENQKYIPKHMRRIISDAEGIENLSDMNMMQFYSEMKKNSYMAKKAIVHNIRDELNEYTKWLNLPENYSQSANEIVAKIHTKQDYNVYKNIINEYIDFLHLHPDKANQIRMKTLKPIVTANDYNRSFYAIDESDKNEDKIASAIVKNIFSKSVNTVVPIDKYPQHEGLPNNKVLVCENCKAIQSKSTFMHDINNPKNKTYIDTYLADITYLIGHNKIEDSKDYIKAFCLNMTKITKGKINFTEEEIKSFRNLQHSASRHEIFYPIQQSKVDIPCAECGSTMLTHDMRKHIEDEMRDCKSIQDFAQLLKKYDKYVGANAKPYANMFISTAKDYPNATDEEFLRIFKKKADNFTEKRLKFELKRYNEQRNYYLYEGSPEQLKNYDLFGMHIRKYIHSKAYLDDELITYYNMCLNPLDIEKAPVKAIYAFTTQVKRAIITHRITTSENKLSNRKENPIYTVVFNIFKTNIATADHLLATSKGGSESTDNLIGLCKTCNKIKSQKDVKTWIIDNKRVAKNIEKQLKVIDKMAKNKQIEGFDDWAEKISQKIYIMTEGKIDIRKEFET